MDDPPFLSSRKNGAAGWHPVDRPRESAHRQVETELDIDDETVLAIWEGLVQDLHEEAGGYELIRWLEMTGSHAFRVSPRQVVEAEDLAQALNGLYDQNVE